MKLVGVVALAITSLVTAEDDDTILELLNQCRSGSYEVCQKIQAKDGADNAYCATYGDVNLDVWKNLCMVTEACHEPKNEIPKNCVERISFSAEYFDLVFNAGLEDDVKAKIGDGVRKQLMNPGVSGWHACQTWAQVVKPDGDILFESNFWGYQEEENYCYLYHCGDDESTPAVEQTFAAFGPRYCS